MPFAKKILLVFQSAESGKDRKVWETKLTEGIGNSFGLNRRRSEKIEPYICRLLLQLANNEVDIEEDAVLGSL